MEPWINQLCLRDNWSGHVKMPGAWEPGGLKDHTAHVIYSEWEKHREQEPFQFTLLLLQFVTAYLVTLKILMTNCKSNHANCDELLVSFGFSFSLSLNNFNNCWNMLPMCSRREVTCCYPQRHPTSNCFQKPFPMIFGHSRSSFASYEEGALFFLSALAKRVTLSHANYPMSHRYLHITAP